MSKLPSKVFSLSGYAIPLAFGHEIIILAPILTLKSAFLNFKQELLNCWFQRNSRCHLNSELMPFTCEQ